MLTQGILISFGEYKGLLKYGEDVPEEHAEKGDIGGDDILEEHTDEGDIACEDIVEEHVDKGDIAAEDDVDEKLRSRGSFCS